MLAPSPLLPTARLGLLAVLPDSWEGRGSAWHPLSALVFLFLLGFTGRETMRQCDRFVFLFLSVTHFLPKEQGSWSCLVLALEWNSSTSWGLAKGLFR